MMAAKLSIRLEATPDAPSTWKRVPLRYLARSVGGGTPSKEKPEFWSGDIPWVSPKDMKSPQVLDTEDHISELALDGSTTQLIKDRAVLIVCRSGILKHTIPVAINQVPVTLNQDMRALLLREDCRPEFLRYVIEGSQDRLLAQWRKAGATVESLESEDMANTAFAVPPLVVQRRLTDFLDRETAKIDALIGSIQAQSGDESILSRYVTLLRERRRSLIHEAVSGQLDIGGSA